MTSRVQGTGRRSTDAEIDSAIDAVARQMTDGSPAGGADFRRRVLARIESGQAPRPSWRAAWVLSPIAVAALVVMAVFVAPGPQHQVRLKPDATASTVRLKPDTTVAVAAPDTQVRPTPDATGRTVRLTPDTTNRTATNRTATNRAQAAAGPPFDPEAIEALAAPPLDLAPLAIDALAPDPIPLEQLDTTSPITIAPITVAPIDITDMQRRQG